MENPKTHIQSPKTLKEFESNVVFQLLQLAAGLNKKRFEFALMKAECLVEDLKKLIAEMNK